MELDVAVVADGDDAAGALAVVLTERDVLLDDLLQLIAPGGEPIRFGFELFGPIVRFDAHQLVLALVEALQLLCRSEEHTSELQSIMRISYAVFCLKKKTT